MISKHGRGYRIDELRGIYPVTLYQIRDIITNEVYRVNGNAFFTSEIDAVDHLACFPLRDRAVIITINGFQYIDTTS